MFDEFQSLMVYFDGISKDLK